MEEVMFKYMIVALLAVGIAVVGCKKGTFAPDQAPAQMSEVCSNAEVSTTDRGFTVAPAPKKEVVRDAEKLEVVPTLPLAGNLVACSMGSCDNKRVVVNLTCGRETASGVPPIELGSVCSNPTQSKVDDIVAAMDRTGFEKIRLVAHCGEVVGTEERKVSAEGKTFTYKAITYEGSNFADRVAVYTLKDANGVDATPLEELMLILNNQIPFNAYSGMWFPHRTWGPALEFGYGRIGANPKVEVVKTLADGRVVKHVTQDGVAPYLAIETVKVIKSRRIESREIQGEPSRRENAGDRYVFPTEQELIERGIIPEGGRLLQVIGVSNIEVDNVVYTSKTISIAVDETQTKMFVTCYPYDR
jgi:hypothetical protein